MTISSREAEIIQEFSFFDNDSDKYAYLIDLGKSMPAFPEEERQEDKLVKGCQSKVWLVAKPEGEVLHFLADSNSVLVKGIVSLLVRVFDGQTVAEIMKAEIGFIDKIGLREMLSMNRANGLQAMLKQIKLYALAIHAQQQ